MLASGFVAGRLIGSPGKSTLVKAGAVSGGTPETRP